MVMKIATLKTAKNEKIAWVIAQLIVDVVFNSQKKFLSVAASVRMC